MKVDYLDASAWVKRYYQEPGTEATQALFVEGVEGAVLACTPLGPVEVLATLSRKRKARQISQAQLQQKRLELEIVYRGEIFRRSATQGTDTDGRPISERSGCCAFGFCHSAPAKFTKIYVEKRGEKCPFY